MATARRLQRPDPNRCPRLGPDCLASIQRGVQPGRELGGAVLVHLLQHGLLSADLQLCSFERGPQAVGFALRSRAVALLPFFLFARSSTRPAGLVLTARQPKTFAAGTR